MFDVRQLRQAASNPSVNRPPKDHCIHLSCAGSHLVYPDFHLTTKRLQRPMPRDLSGGLCNRSDSKIRLPCAADMAWLEADRFEPREVELPGPHSPPPRRRCRKRHLHSVHFHAALRGSSGEGDHTSDFTRYGWISHPCGIGITPTTRSGQEGLQYLSQTHLGL